MAGFFDQNPSVTAVGDVVVVVLPQSPEGDYRSARATCENRRVNHSWCMCVGSRGYGGLVMAGMKVVDGMHA